MSKTNLSHQQTIVILSSALDSILQAIEDTALCGGTPLDDTDFFVANAIDELKKVQKKVELPKLGGRS
jgi:hypothetical protein